MAIGIQHDIVALARKRGDHAQIGLIAGRKDHGMIHAVKVLERVLTFPMALISAVENAAARRSRSEMVERILASLDHIEIGRASCRERVWQYGSISVVAV